MTPPATATSRSAARTSTGSSRAAVRAPRRISGPAGPARVAAAVAIPAPGIALPRQRPARPNVKPRRAPARKTTRRGTQDAPGIALRTLDAFESLSVGAVLDKLIRGRIWIGLLAFSLIGIVAMQLVVLELNTGIGRTLTRAATLQRENAQLGIEDSMYSAESRVAPLAVAGGMTLAPPGTVHFVQAVPADLSRAVSALSAPIQASASTPAGSTEPAASAPQSSTAGSTSESSTEAGSAPQSTEAKSAAESTETSSTSAPTEARSAAESTEASSTPAPTEATEEAAGSSPSAGG